jgi:sec-independent protein translocase protein TatA
MLGDLFDSPWKILIIAVVVLVLFGSRKLPDAARSLGRSMRILKSEIHDLHDDDDARADQPAQPQQLAPAAGVPAAGVPMAPAVGVPAAGVPMAPAVGVPAAGVPLAPADSVPAAPVPPPASVPLPAEVQQDNRPA